MTSELVPTGMPIGEAVDATAKGPEFSQPATADLAPNPGVDGSSNGSAIKTVSSVKRETLDVGPIHGHRSATGFTSWWFMRLFKFVFRQTPPAPHKGPQVFDYPPSRKLIGKTTEYESWESQGWKMVALSPAGKKGGKGTSRAILYFHGSGWVNPIAPMHWVYTSHLAQELDAEVSVVPYPLAPGNGGRETLLTLVKVYADWIKRVGDREIILVGDSAGGQIAFSLQFAIHDAGLRLAPQIVAISPGLDLKVNNPVMEEIAPNDPALTIEMIREGARKWVSKDGSGKGEMDSFEDPYLSPMYGDLSILQKSGTRVILVSGSADIAHADIEKFVGKLEVAGVNTYYIIGKDMIHDFPMGFRLVSESKVATARIVEIVKRNSEDIGLQKAAAVDREIAADAGV